MGIEQPPIPLDSLPVKRKAIQLSSGEKTDCFISPTGNWYYQQPKLDATGNPVVEDDVELLERVTLPT